MNAIVFSKYEGLGNDFILIDESQDNNCRNAPLTSLSLRQALCDRKRGIGADGVISLLPATSEGSTVFMHVTNADGSIPENCGNGLRCVARWLLDSGKISQGQTFSIDTFSGSKKCFIENDLISVELGSAVVNASLDLTVVSLLAEEFAVRLRVPAPKPLAFVDLGNPHLVLEALDIEQAQTELGPMLEKLPIFAQGVNVSFVNVLSERKIDLRVWERGAGATDACGSGAGASVAALVSARKLPAGIPIQVHFKNGTLAVVALRRSDREFGVEMTGRARRVFSGIWENSERVCEEVRV